MSSHNVSCQAERTEVRGAAGNLEVLVECPRLRRSPATVALVCHPHPLYGGSMDNKVVYTLAKTFLGLGAVCVRFNFRGVGLSQGSFADGDGESDDLLHLAAWLRQRHAPAELWLAGFSFGAYVALRAHHQIQPQRLVLVAPPLTRCGRAQCELSAVPTLIVQGGQDDVVDPRGVENWLHTQRHPADYRLLTDAEHFFHGQLGRLRETVRNFLGSA